MKGKCSFYGQVEQTDSNKREEYLIRNSPKDTWAGVKGFTLRPCVFVERERKQVFSRESSLWMMPFEGQGWLKERLKHKKGLKWATGGCRYLGGFKSELVIKMSPVQSFKAAGSMRLERTRCHIISENKNSQRRTRRQSALKSGRNQVCNTQKSTWQEENKP